MAYILSCYLILLGLSTTLFRTGLPAPIRSPTPNTDSKSTWTDVDLRVSDTLVGTSEAVLKVGSPDGTMTPSNFGPFQDSATDWTADEDSSLAAVGFHLSSAVDVSEINSSGGETTESVQHENKPQVPHSEEELKSLLGSLHSAIIDANLFLVNNVTDLDDSEGRHGSSRDAGIRSDNSTPGEVTSLSPVTSTNNLPSIETSQAVSHKGTVNVILESEKVTQEIRPSLNSGNSSDRSESSSGTTITEDSLPESTAEIPNRTGLSVTHDMHAGTTSQSLTDSIPENFATATWASNATNSEVGTETALPSTRADGTQTVSVTVRIPLASTEGVSTALNSPSCPAPGTCVLWFLASDACQSDSDCSDSRMCCRVRCSRACINS